MEVKRKINNKYGLSTAEQKTTVAFKVLSSENELLKKSLEKTQNKLEKMREEKFEQKKNNSILEYKLKSVIWVEFFKFSSSAGIGVAGSYVIDKDYYLAMFIGVPSIVVFVVALIFSNK
jgi:pyruvate/oxaloacetate carboxyltransferase